jgi:hypothetical protein
MRYRVGTRWPPTVMTARPGSQDQGGPFSGSASAFLVRPPHFWLAPAVFPGEYASKVPIER